VASLTEGAAADLEAAAAAQSCADLVHRLERSGRLRSHPGADDDDKSALCPPNPYPSTVEDFARSVLRQQLTSDVWNSDAEVLGWMARSRTNAVRDMYDQLGDERLQAALARYVEAGAPAIENLRVLLAAA
jgi:hypothetical protein